MPPTSATNVKLLEAPDTRSNTRCLQPSSSPLQEFYKAILDEDFIKERWESLAKELSMGPQKLARILSKGKVAWMQIHSSKLATTSFLGLIGTWHATVVM